MADWNQMQLISTHICKTRDVGNHGNLFGGVMLAWIDEAGAAIAAEFAETGKIVTKHISALDFTYFPWIPHRFPWISPRFPWIPIDSP